MSDGPIVMPPQERPAIQLPEEGPGRAGGMPLPFLRHDGVPSFASDEIVLDIEGRIGVSISDGDMEVEDGQEEREEDFGENLAERLDDVTLAKIGEEIVTGVETDLAAHTEWLQQYEKGLALLGTKIEDLAKGSDNKRSVSRAGDTTMLEAIIKYEAAAEAELLPASGPVKVPTIGQVAPEEEQIAKDFEDDLNYYLTEVATEYYADTPVMLTQQAYCGEGYKKVYFCPMRRRPVSESIQPTDMIISEDATDLDNANRVTHRIEITRPMLRRMQVAGQYRDVKLIPTGIASGLGTLARQGLKMLDGTTPVSTARTEDQPYEIFETDTFLDVDEHGINGKYEREAPENMPLPYKIAVERNTRVVLGIWRNWERGDPLYMKENMYVRYGLVPSLGFHPWGFLQLLGNQTLALRAILRLLIAAGMFSNFPGGLKAKNARTATNELGPAPGEFVDVDIQTGGDITKLVMPLPYKGPDAVFVQLMEIIKQDAQKLGGTVTIDVGEGRANVPVGSILAMVEQQIQVMAGVHKRNHRAQKEEFRKLRKLFMDDPSSLSLLVRDRPRDANRPARIWQKAEEFSDLNITPASDPNVPSHIHRLLMANVLILLAQQLPQYFDLPAVAANAVSAVGASPSEFIVRPDQGGQAPPPPDPKVIAATIKAQEQQTQGQVEAQTEAAKLQLAREKLAVEASKSAADNQTAVQVAHAKMGADAAQPYHEAAAAGQTAGGIG